MQQFRDRSRGLLGAVFVRPGAADPEQVFHRAEVLDVLPDDRHRKGQILGPIHSPSRAHVPGISLAFQAFEQAIELARKLRGHHHLEAAHIEDVINMFDVHRALLDARAAGGAGPQDIGVDDPGHPIRDLDGSYQRPSGLAGESRQAEFHVLLRPPADRAPWRTRAPVDP